MTTTTDANATDGLTDADENRGRNLRGNTRLLALTVAVLAGLYHIFIAGFGTPGPSSTARST
ncbi:hypothetical protein [Halalkalicoccus salilacus]|uniref:hypothetical protein n=1 Tax=Halalkalicoccus sp. GCM10025704 TaxID=3252662 RepID=UPI003608AC32